MGSAPSSDHVHLLLVEDNAGDVRLVREALRLGGQEAEISVARDGVEALTFLRRRGPHSAAGRPDLVLLDLNLPRKSGREVLSEIKADAELCEIPVVVLTTSSSTEDIVFSYRCHANTYIIKPVNLDQYVEMLRGLQEYWTRIARLPTGTGSARPGINGPQRYPGPAG